METARSLESLADGEVATIEQILFDALRSHCAERGLRQGAQVSGARGDPERVVVETPAGAVSCERKYARFVQVTAGAASPVEEADGTETTP